MALMFPDMNSEDKEKRMKAVDELLKLEYDKRIDELKNILIEFKNDDISIYDDVIIRIVKTKEFEIEDYELFCDLIDLIEDFDALDELIINGIYIPKDISNNNEEKRMIAVKKFIEHEDDMIEEYLSLIMEECNHEDVIFELLKVIAKTGCALTIGEKIESSVKRAIYKIKDESKLIELANINPCTDELIFTITTVDCIRDKNALADLAKKSESFWIDVDLVEEFNITDNDSLIDIAKNAKRGAISESALGRLKYNLENENSSEDFEEIFIDIAKNAKSPRVRKDAIEKIKNQDILIDILKDDRADIVRANALEKIGDSWFLSEEIAYECIDNMALLEVAINNIERDYVIESIVNKTNEVLIKAIKRLNEIKE